MAETIDPARDIYVFVPVGSAALVAAALFAPGWLKRAARFLEAIAEGR